MPRDYSNEGTGSGQFDRVWRSDSGAGIAQGSTRQPTINEQQSQNKVLPWWEVPEQQQQMGPPQIYRQSPSQQLRSNLDFSDRPLAVSQNSHLSQSTFPSHSHLQRDQPRYRPFPPSIPPPLSQLPYQPPSREWNQALPTSYSTWEHSDVNTGLLPVEHHYESPSASSTGSGNLVPAVSLLVFRLSCTPLNSRSIIYAVGPDLRYFLDISIHRSFTTIELRRFQLCERTTPQFDYQ